MNFLKSKFFILFAILVSCIGTDYVDNELTGSKIVLLSDAVIALKPNEQIQVMAEYFDCYDQNNQELIIKRDVPLVWTSSDSDVVEVTEDGLVTAKGNGQSDVQAFYENTFGPQIKVTVTSDMDGTKVATVEVLNPIKNGLVIGEEIQLTAVVRNINGEVLEDKTIEWFSENSSILTVSPFGLVSAAGPGVADIHAKSEGIKSNIINFSVDGLVRTGTFVSAGGYKASGTTRLEFVNNQLILTLNDNFDTDFVLGTYIYLANSTNGSIVRSSGFQVAQIFNDGGKTFNISQLNSSIRIDDYKYVIVLCYPASATFGYAELK